jgi:hypothetical protein
MRDRRGHDIEPGIDRWPREHSGELRRAWGRVVRREKPIAYLLVPLLVLAPMAAGFWLPAAWFVPVSIAGFALLALGAAVGVSVTRRIRMLTFLECGLCPACVYRLDGLAAEEDGCVVCPECGAAWRVG